MPGEIVHFEIPADNMAQGREFWGSLFGWRFEAFPGPFEYHVARISAQTGGDHGHGARRARAGTELEERLHLERLGVASAGMPPTSCIRPKKSAL
jgi:predicted enzyme related to lactoylglutathione lyase